jgi:hypothetical protein
MQDQSVANWSQNHGAKLAVAIPAPAGRRTTASGGSIEPRAEPPTPGMDEARRAGTRAEVGKSWPFQFVRLWLQSCQHSTCQPRRSASSIGAPRRR